MDSAADDRPLDPAGMLALVEHQQSHVERRSARFVPWILFAWAIAWTAGYLALWLIDGLRPGFALELPVAVTVFFGLTAIAVTVSAVLGARSDRGVRATSESAFGGTVFGAACAAALVSVFVLGAQLIGQGMSISLAHVYLPVIYTLVIGVVYLMAGAMWRAVPCVVIGGLLMAVALTAGFFPYPTPYLVVGIGGGAVFVGGWLVARSWVRGCGSAARR